MPKVFTMAELCRRWNKTPYRVKKLIERGVLAGPIPRRNNSEMREWDEVDVLSAEAQLETERSKARAIRAKSTIRFSARTAERIRARGVMPKRLAG